MANVIGISGKRGTGKSLLCNPYLKARGFQIFSFADPLKEDVRKYYGLSKEHTDGKLKEVACDKLGGKTPREAMIAEGQLRRTFSENGMYWVHKTFQKIKQLPKDSLVVIPDVRFKNEAAYISYMGGHIFRLERHQHLNIYKEVLNDSSETDLDNYSFALTLPAEKNETPQDLEKFADSIINYIKGSNK
jgi:hypothetical protein